MNTELIHMLFIYIDEKQLRTCTCIWILVNLKLNLFASTIWKWNETLKIWRVQSTMLDLVLSGILIHKTRKALMYKNSNTPEAIWQNDFVFIVHKWVWRMYKYKERMIESMLFNQRIPLYA